MLGLIVAGSLATIIAAIAAVVSAGVGCIAIVRVKQVHVIVNSAMSKLVERNEQLVKALQRQGGEIPSSPDSSDKGGTDADTQVC